MKEKYSGFFIRGITELSLKLTHLKQSKLNNPDLIDFKNNSLDSVSNLLRTVE